MESEVKGMEEKIIIQGDMGSHKKMKRIPIILLVLTLIFGSLWFYFGYKYSEYESKVDSYRNLYKQDWVTKEMYEAKVKLLYKEREQFEAPKNIFLVLGVVSAVALVCYFDVLVSSKKMHITVSDKRVYGINATGKTVDLPIDSISSVSSARRKGVVVLASSGKNKFFGLSNRDEIHKAITNLLMERQNNPKQSTQTIKEIQQSDADEIKKFKDLLDSGIITQEEFDAKKKQLLER